MTEETNVPNDDPLALRTEIARLRETVARLERQVSELDQLAHHDSLVPVPNRRGFMRQLARLIDRAERYGDSSAMLFVDVDGLKMLNDCFGHETGDAALIHIAGLLTGGTRQSDCVARFGGDEFAVLLERVDLRKAHETALRLTNLIAESMFLVGDRAIPLSAAIGIAEIKPGDTPEDVLARADQAMYEQKAAA